MGIIGFGNLAVKVSDLDAAVRFFASAGASIAGREEWHGGERADVMLGPVQLTLFTRAIYEDTLSVGDQGFLHMSVFTEDLDAQLLGHEVLWGPEEVSGSFGTRRIAFVRAPGDIRLEFMEEIEGAP